jgi:polysaccharide deacetylase family protein (PEP-CTERM system associated)
LLLVNTFDVEPWWATVPPCVELDRWDEMPDRSEAPLMDYLDLCDEAGVKCTFFFIGWYARRFPRRIGEVVRRGHEAGCHSLNHEDAASQTPTQFRDSTRVAKALIEDAVGQAVTAYRAHSFSFPPERCAELLGTLADLGFTLDSSIATAGRIHGGGYRRQDFPAPRSLRESHGVDLFEIPVPGVTLAGRDVQVFGGGYLRLAPQPLLRRLAQREPYQVLYMHPHDFDRELPPLPGRGALSNLRRRITMGDPRCKLRELFRTCTVRSCGQLQAEEAALHA